MAKGKQRPSFEKRRRERDKQRKRAEKRERRADRKIEKEERAADPDAPAEVILDGPAMNRGEYEEIDEIEEG